MNYNPATARPDRTLARPFSEAGIRLIRSAIRLNNIERKLIHSLAINDPSVSHACVTASDEFGYGVFSWHSSAGDAQYNAKLTGGKSVRVHRDANGEVMTPKKAAKALRQRLAA